MSVDELRKLEPLEVLLPDQNDAIYPGNDAWVQIDRATINPGADPAWMSVQKNVSVASGLIPNSDFEAASPVSWSAFGSTCTRDATEFHSGSSSLKVLTNGVPGNFSEGVNFAGLTVPAATGVPVSFWLKGPSGQHFYARLFSGTAVEFYGTGGWQQIAQDFVSGGAAATFQIRTYDGSPSVTFYVDDVVVAPDPAFLELER